MNFKIQFHEPYRSSKCDTDVRKLLLNKKASLFGFGDITNRNEKIIKKKIRF